MTPTTYTFQVTNTDESLGVMEVVYRADGYSDKLVGMPLPLAGESLEDVVARYAPRGAWAVEAQGFTSVAVGTTGVITPSAPPQPPSQIDPPAVAPATALQYASVVL